MPRPDEHAAFSEPDHAFMTQAHVLIDPDPPGRHRSRKMKALSIVSPGGSRIASGQKTLEIRRWHPGLEPSEDLLIVENTRFLHNDGEEDEGHAVAIVRVRAVRPFEVADIAAACASYHEEGWLAWELIDVRAITGAAPIRAARGIYEVDLPAPHP